MSLRILSLHSYPVKSCAGIDHTEVAITARGLHRDRQWVIVDEQGIFMTQRQHARMALIRPRFLEADLVLSATGMPELTVPWSTGSQSLPQVNVRIWKQDTQGFDEGDAVAQWLSQFLGLPCRLLRVHPDAHRTASPPHVNAWLEHNADWADGFPASHEFGFADGFPFLIANQGSLDELNRRLLAKGQAAVPMNRFRPNIVVQGLDAYEEDYLAGMQTGGLMFAFVKRCARCPIPNIDQTTAVSAPEPGITLAEHRQFKDGVLFGVNAVVSGAGSNGLLRVGDAVEPHYDL